MSVLLPSVQIPVEVLGFQSLGNIWDFIHRRETQHRHSWLLPIRAAVFEVGFPSAGKANCRSVRRSDLGDVICGRLAVLKRVEVQNCNRIGVGPRNDQHSRWACISSTGSQPRQWICWHRPSAHRAVGRWFESIRGRQTKANQALGNAGISGGIGQIKRSAVGLGNEGASLLI